MAVLQRRQSRYAGYDVSPPGDQCGKEMEQHARLIALRHQLSAPVNTLISSAYVLFDACERGSGLRRELRETIIQANRLLEILKACLGGSDRVSATSHNFELVWTPEQAREWQQSADAIANQLAGLLDRDECRQLPDAGHYLRKMQSAAREAEASLARSPQDGDLSRRIEPSEDMLAMVLEILSTASKEERGSARTAAAGTILVVDDNSAIRETISRYLKSQGLRVVTSTNGSEALSALRALAFDAVLLDIVMPVLNGYETLHRIKKDENFKDIPVVMLSGLNDRESVAHCLALGASDYITKPFDPIQLLARITSSVENKRLKDREKASHGRLQEEQKRSHGLLLNILPESVAKRLEYGQKMIANHYDSVTVVFCDLVNFTPYSSSVSAIELVSRLNSTFNAFDALAAEYGVEKIKTIGDAYLAVAGLPERCDDHADRVARLALAMLESIDELNQGTELPLQVRIGMHSGPVTAGVIGKLKFAYDIWGDTVNVASRMESSGLPGAIQVSQSSYELLNHRFRFESRPTQEIKGKGPMCAWLLQGRLEVGAVGPG